jgi:hypothetical protein
MSVSGCYTEVLVIGWLVVGLAIFIFREWAFVKICYRLLKEEQFKRAILRESSVK